MMSGCNKADSITDSEVVTSSVTSSEASHTEPSQIELYEFNPHLYSALLAREIPQDHWDSLYNLCDALREGRDTFECSSKEAYEWCMDSSTLANMIPPACLNISGKSPDGTVSYENGVGRIYYRESAEAYKARQAEFEQMVVDILNSTLEKDDDEFEKCLKLYDYMESNYNYDDDGREDGVNSDGFVYHTLRTHEGHCIDFSGVYCYLLRQAGVEAISVGCMDGVDHEWTYVLINGKGYYIDPTWSLKSTRDTEDLYLDYFMMTDKIRTDTGCPVDDLNVQMLPSWRLRDSSLSVSATDDSYYAGNYAVFKSLDEEKKILYYIDAEDKEQQISYGQGNGY